MGRFILVHGAMHGGWCWEALVPLLESLGHQVVALDLPGARDELPPQQISLHGQADAVVAALDADREPAIVVGHSLGGMAVSQAAEHRPEAVRQLVYLCALLPLNGESAVNVLDLNEDQSVIASFQFRSDGQSYSLPPERRRAVLYHDCPEARTEGALLRLVPQSTQMMQDSVHLSPARFGSIPKFYFETTDDRALCVAFQRAMIARYPTIEVRTLACAHSPFYACPDTLADLLDALTRPDAVQSKNADQTDSAARLRRASVIATTPRDSKAAP